MLHDRQDFFFHQGQSEFSSASSSWYQSGLPLIIWLEDKSMTTFPIKERREKIPFLKG